MIFFLHVQILALNLFLGLKTQSLPDYRTSLKFSLHVFGGYHPSKIQGVKRVGIVSERLQRKIEIYKIIV